MSSHPTIRETQLLEICNVLGDTEEGLTGREIGILLGNCGIGDPLDGHTKRHRLYEALSRRQKQDRCANNVIGFITSAMDPVRYIKIPSVFEKRRAKLNKVLAFGGLELAEDGQIRRWQAARKIIETCEAPIKRSNNVETDKIALLRIRTEFEKIHSFEPQARGFAFESFLSQLFDFFGLAARRAFRLAGEQIDGSFQLDAETYLLEARWRDAQAAFSDLAAFSSKVERKAKWSRGLFVSYAGFTQDGLKAFSSGNSISVICMDGLDLSHVLDGHLQLAEVLRAKSRRAAETNNPHVPVRDLFSCVI